MTVDVGPNRRQAIELLTFQVAALNVSVHKQHSTTHQRTVNAFRSEYARVQRTVGAMPPASGIGGMGVVVAILAIAAGAVGYVLLSPD